MITNIKEQHMKITRLAQSTVQIKNNDGRSLLFDPGSYNLDQDILEHLELLTGDVLVVTHKHADHYCPDILRALPPTVDNRFTIAQEDMAEPLLRELGFDVCVVKPGDRLTAKGFTLSIVGAEHIVREDVIPCFGLIVEADGKRVYHASDTNFKDPKELGVSGDIDWVLVPFSGRGVTMDADEAIAFVRAIGPKGAIPVHYDSPKDAHLNPVDFAKRLETECGVKTAVLAYGEEIAL